MTAQAADRKTPQKGPSPIVSTLEVPVAASTKIYEGSMVAVNQSGYAIPADASTAGLRILGVAVAQADNSSGAASAINVKVRRGAFGMKNSSSTGALTIADCGRPCFVVDDQTVSRESAAGARPFAGNVYDVDGDDSLVYVELGTTRDAINGGVDIHIIAGETLTSDQFKLVKVNSSGQVVKSGAGERAVGVLQNAPASGALAIVRIQGITRAKADATGITRGDMVSSGASGVCRATTNAATGLGVVDTSDAGGATDALKGAHCVGVALETAAANEVFGLALTHHGVAASTAV